MTSLHTSGETGYVRNSPCRPDGGVFALSVAFYKSIDHLQATVGLQPSITQVNKKPIAVLKCVFFVWFCFSVAYRVAVECGETTCMTINKIAFYKR